MTLAQKIEQLLKDELKSDNIKTIVELAEFLKFKESQKRWDQINESETEFITDEEKKQIEELKAKGEFINQDELLKELGIDKDPALQGIAELRGKVQVNERQDFKKARRIAIDERINEIKKQSGP